ncbi:WXG100 family type VII secretion target [Actinomadura livida]|uniref:Uncharacterized protein YukE n=1 Tax=Actinomadura livida TaxID=79909 RepID=A0A7W7N0X7_9ACTN|nr:MULTISPECIES: hypothetical protein [Actinomadura]MBB4777365.1 uncharacterized protein YukE [Actinomadura catellatispora]GGU19742.1 hypothetical protein GCM10010208_50800 [Actinomadura livida]
MTLTLPPVLAGLVEKAGGRWPQADEDRLGELGEQWRSLAGEMRGLKGDGSAVSRRVGGENQGASIDAFGRLWETFEQHVDTVCGALDAIADGVRAMAQAVLGAKTAIAEAAAATYGKILEVRRRASMSGGIWCVIGVAVLWLLRFLGRYILRLLGWLVKWIWRGIVWLFKKAAAAIAAAYSWFKGLFKGKKDKKPSKTNPWANGKPPQKAQDKVPKEWGPGQANKKALKDPSKPGWRWRDPNNPNNGIRIDKGDPNSPWPSQRVDHVVINSNGKILDRYGNPIKAPKPTKTPEAHIPLDEWLKWSGWSHP